MSMRQTITARHCLAALTLAATAASVSAAGTAGLTGKYFGPVEQLMNAPAYNYGPIGRPPALYSMRNDQVAYGVLGFSVSPMYWLWDFDNKRILLGGAELYAMMNFHPTIRLFSPTRARIEGEHVPVHPTTPTQVEQQHMATLQDNGDGTYTADFNLQIFFSLAGYPLGSVPSKFQVTRTEQGELSIITLDEAPDGKLGADGLVSDGIPGVVKFAQGEDPVLGLFPFRVSPAWESIDHRRLKPVDESLDSNGDGISDAVALGLGLNPYVPDTDGDGIDDKDEIGPNWAMPLDSDGDGVHDALEPGAAANNRTQIANLRLANGESVTLKAAEGEVFGAITSSRPETIHAAAEFSLGAYAGPLAPRWLGQPDRFLNLGTETGENLLPKADDQGRPYYNLGVLEVRQTGAENDAEKFQLVRRVFLDAEEPVSSLQSAETRLANRQADYAADPSERNATRLQTAQNLYDTALATYQTAVAEKEQRLNAVYRLPVTSPNRSFRQMAIDWLGADFEQVTTSAEALTLMDDRKGVNASNVNQQLIDKTVPVTVSFDNGVPQGLRVFQINDFYNSVSSYEYQGITYPGMSANWNPTIVELVFQQIDDNTVVIHTAGSGDSQTFDAITKEVAFLAKLSTLALLHLEEDRQPPVYAPDPSTPTPEPEPEPEQKPEDLIPAPTANEGGSSGGGALGAILLPLLAGLKRRRRNIGVSQS